MPGQESSPVDIQTVYPLIFATSIYLCAISGAYMQNSRTGVNTHDDSTIGSSAARAAAALRFAFTIYIIYIYRQHCTVPENDRERYAYQLMRELVSTVLVVHISISIRLPVYTLYIYIVSLALCVQCVCVDSAAVSRPRASSKYTRNASVAAASVGERGGGGEEAEEDDEERERRKRLFTSDEPTRREKTLQGAPYEDAPTFFILEGCAGPDDREKKKSQPRRLQRKFRVHQVGYSTPVQALAYY